MLTYNQISSATLGVDAGTIIVSNIPQTYDTLQIFISARNASANALDYIFITNINSDSGSNYSSSALNITSSLSSTRSTISTNTASGLVAGGTSNASRLAGNIITIPQYSTSGIFKTILCESSDANQISYIAARWASSSAISSITFQSGGGNFKAVTTIDVFGIKNA